MASIILKRITKRFTEKVVVLKDFDLHISDGEFLVLVGPSGCGKSTTLRLIAGLEDISEGDIYIDDLRVNDLPPKDRDIAMVFQNYALYPHMDVYRNMAFGLKLRKFKESEIRERVEAAADILEIHDLLQRKPKELSGGQRQRVALGRAIVRKPKAFLFDEPLSNLDAKLRVQMRAQIKALHARLKTTMVYVTHDQVEAMTMGDRIVILKDGLIQQVGSPLEIYDHPANRFVAGFIGSPSMNFIPVTVHVGKTTKLQHTEFILELSAPSGHLRPYDGAELMLGVRPENLHLADGADTSPHVQWPLHLLEPLGHEILVHLQAIDHTVVIKSSSIPEDVALGDPVGVRFDVNALHFFEPRDGRAITR